MATILKCDCCLSDNDRRVFVTDKALITNHCLCNLQLDHTSAKHTHPAQQRAEALSFVLKICIIASKDFTVLLFCRPQRTSQKRSLPFTQEETEAERIQITPSAAVVLECPRIVFCTLGFTATLPSYGPQSVIITCPAFSEATCRKYMLMIKIVGGSRMLQNSFLTLNPW